MLDPIRIVSLIAIVGLIYYSLRLYFGFWLSALRVTPMPSKGDFWLPSPTTAPPAPPPAPPSSRETRRLTDEVLDRILQDLDKDEEDEKKSLYLRLLREEVETGRCSSVDGKQ